MVAPVLLTLDRGNTTLDAMLHGPTPRRQRLLDTHGLIAFLAADRPSAVVGVTVVPGALEEPLARMRAMGVPIAVVGSDLKCPLPLDYETPQTLGADRWLSALAAHRRFGRSVVIDCGSATTVNLVEADGTFRGGAIAPGLRALVEGMSAVTPRLPRAEPELADAFPARSSAACVNVGALAMFCGGIERLVSEALASARGPCVVTITGGHAEDYLSRGRLRPRWEPTLVHEGLRFLASESGWNC